MKNILILGAGLSASSMIRYLLNLAEAHDWTLSIVDQDERIILSKTNNHPRSKAFTFNALDRELRKPYIAQADLVISMLPARFHVDVAEDCVALGKHLITPSYISNEMKALDTAAKEANIVIMNEIGVDPGIDHMSAMKIIHEIKQKGGEIDVFKSFCGGLIAPESDNNPWHYKFTWNPRNVVVAGQGGASCFIRNGQYKYIPYHRLFERLDYLNIPGFGDFVGYANRDSLSYRSTYGLENIPTIFRGTLRRPNFCEAWQVFVELGMTDDSYAMTDASSITPRQFVNSFLPFDATLQVEEKFKNFLGKERLNLFGHFDYLDLFSEEFTISIDNPTPARILQTILEPKLKLEKGDKDMLVMVHEFEYTLNQKRHKITSSMVNIGEDQMYTSMSNTVGLPVAICAKMILTDKLTERGVTLPIKPAVYHPILDELETFGITFTEKEEIIS